MGETVQRAFSFCASSRQKSVDLAEITAGARRRHKPCKRVFKIIYIFFGINVLCLHISSFCPSPSSTSIMQEFFVDASSFILSEISTPAMKNTSESFAPSISPSRSARGIFLSIRYSLSFFVPPPNLVNISPSRRVLKTTPSGSLSASKSRASLSTCPPDTGMTVTVRFPNSVSPVLNGISKSLKLSPICSAHFREITSLV